MGRIQHSRFQLLSTFVVGLAAALVLQALCCVYIGFFAFVLCPIYVVGRAVGVGQRTTKGTR